MVTGDAKKGSVTGDLISGVSTKGASVMCQRVPGGATLLVIMLHSIQYSLQDTVLVHVTQCTQIHTDTVHVLCTL